MKGVKLYNRRVVEKLISPRNGEIKFGQKIEFIENFEELESRKEKYVLFGIPEDIGVRANMGKQGTVNAWKVCLKYLLNVQANQYTNPQNLILLGEVNCEDLMATAANIGEEDPNYLIKLGELVSKLDEVVSRVVSSIISAGKIPIIIGGGHNNAYGNIKGASLALKNPVNIMNIDAHTDLRKTEHRHSGNGFSFARKEKYLGKYCIFGVHQNYTPDYIFKEMDDSPEDQYHLYEHLLLKSPAEVNKIFEEELRNMGQENFGFELDCDSIRNFPSSAQTPGGFSYNMIRNFVAIAAREENICYFHICEAAPTQSSEAEVGKALSYFITDFINP